MAERSYLPLRLKNNVYENFRLPVVSTRSLTEVLEKEGISSFSTIEGNRTFSWYDIEGITSAFSMPVDSENVLHVRLREEAFDFLSNNEGFVLFESEGLDIPKELGPFWGRFIVVAAKSKIHNHNSLAMVQEIFLRMLRWENQLNFQVETKAPLHDLLNVGTAMFRGFIFVVGIDDNVIGYSDTCEYPNELYRKMIEEDKAIPSSFFSHAIKRGPSHSKLFEVDVMVDDWGGCTCVVVPVYYHGSLFGFVVHVSDEEDILPGFKDQFAHFSGYVLDSCRSMLQVGVEKDMPHFYFFSSLLRGEVFTQTTIERNLAHLGIPLNSVFKVVVLNLQDSEHGADVLSNAMRSLNNWHSFIVLHNDYLTAILYDERRDGALSHRDTFADCQAAVFEPYGVVCGFSQVFSSIRDLRFGFYQASFALENKSSVLLESALLPHEKGLSAVSFEMAIPYFLITKPRVDDEFLEFCFSMSPLEAMVNSDLENGSRDFALLWLFLSYERNASLVGRRIFMHRNSVLYNIKKIEKRFGIDLDDRYIREMLIFDYRFLFMRLSQEDVDTLFDIG